MVASSTPPWRLLLGQSPLPFPQVWSPLWVNLWAGIAESGHAGSQATSLFDSRKREVFRCGSSVKEGAGVCRWRLCLAGGAADTLVGRFMKVWVRPRARAAVLWHVAGGIGGGAVLSGTPCPDPFWPHLSSPSPDLRPRTALAFGKTAELSKESRRPGVAKLPPGALTAAWVTGLGSAALCTAGADQDLRLTRSQLCSSRWNPSPKSSVHH